MNDAHIDSDTFGISFRKGACLLQTLHLISENDLTSFFYDFVIVKDYGSAPIIEKTCCVFEDNWIVLDLDSNETDLLSSLGENPKTYYWGLILHDKGDYRETVVPRDFEEKPEFTVYPGIEIC